MWKQETSAEKVCQIVVTSHDSTEFEKSNICMVQARSGDVHAHTQKCLEVW